MIVTPDEQVRNVIRIMHERAAKIIPGALVELRGLVPRLTPPGIQRRSGFQFRLGMVIAVVQGWATIVRLGSQPSLGTVEVYWLQAA